MIKTKLELKNFRRSKVNDERPTEVYGANIYTDQVAFFKKHEVNFSKFLRELLDEYITKYEKKNRSEK